MRQQLMDRLLGELLNLILGLRERECLEHPRAPPTRAHLRRGPCGVPVHAGTVLITPREVDAGGRACLSISLSLGHRLGDLRPPVAAVTPDILLQDVHDCRAVDKEGPLWQDRAARQS